MNVLSIFDGCACARVALERVGWSGTYYASEINPWSIKIARKNYPDIQHLGDVRTFNTFVLPPIDVLVGGSPCQDLSRAGTQRGLVGGRSSLFFEFARLLRLLKPRYFLLENIALMRKVDQFIISAYLNVKPILLDSALFSAQSRRRLYWTNIPLTPLPSPSLRLVRDILEPAIEGKPMAFTPIPRRGKYGQPFVNGKPDYSLSPWQVGYYQKDQQGRRIYSIDAKGTPLHSTGGGGGARMGLYAINGKVRPLTPTEAERLQTLPDQYTQGVSESQRFIMLGNAFTVEVIAHLFRGIEQQF